MHAKSAGWVWLLLTTVVVNTCMQIEILNVENNYYLPRTDFGPANPKWRTASSHATQIFAEKEVFFQRGEAYQREHPDEPMPDDAFFRGPCILARRTSVDRSAIACE